jgi:hypothetical protein
VREVRGCVSPALVVAIIAMVLAGASGATAARSLITGADVKNDSLTAPTSGTDR